jgi:CheY-like chemotaxis protein
LIVDDIEINRRILRNQMQAWGMRLDCASSAVEALAMLGTAVAEADPYAIAIVDCLMPGIDGLELGARIRNDAAICDTRLLMLTSAAARGGASAAAAAGFDAFLTKPSRPDVLRQAIGTVLVPERDRKTLVTRHALPNERSQSTTGETVAAEGLRVLLAEDNVVNQKVAIHMLTRLGCSVDVAASGTEALDLWTRLPYDVILMDCQMPELDGFAATRLIRSRERTGVRVPIIALTASAMQGDREVCLQAGMDDHVSKPVSFEKLGAAFDRVLSVSSRG